jgi:exopolysaccharide biosynthesis polyprenyl glycosylphosphotransferase
MGTAAYPSLFLDGIYNRAWFRVLSAIADALALGVAWQLTLALRLLLNPFLNRTFNPGNLGSHAIPLNHVLGVWAVTAVLVGLYGLHPARSLGEGLMRLVNSVVVFCGAIVLYAFFWREQGADLSRSFILLFAVVSFACLVTSQYLLVITINLSGRKLMPEERILVAGQGECARDIIYSISGESSHARVVGVILPEAAAEGQAGPLYQPVTRLAEVINRERANRLIIANGSLTQGDLDECIRVCRRMGVMASHALATPQQGVRFSLSTIYGIPMVEMRGPSFTRAGEIVKRSVDIAASLLLLVAFAPLMLLCALLIKLTSEGPVFYNSSRVGKGGRYFTFFKFRSMYVDSSRQWIERRNEKSGHLFKVRRDPRVTPAGRILRRLSLDELPQLINVLLGDMSIVGPRPLPAEDLDPDGHSREFSQWAQLRSTIRPGLTGLWQVKGRSDLSFEEMIALDNEYIRNWSLSLDARILLVTPIAVITGHGAY